MGTYAKLIEGVTGFSAPEPSAPEYAQPRGDELVDAVLVWGQRAGAGVR